MKTEMELKHEINWFESLLSQLQKGNYETCERAIKAAIKMLEKQSKSKNVIALKRKDV